MKTTITGLAIQVEVTQYDDEGRVSGRPEKPPTFQVLEAGIPQAVLEWVQAQIKLGG